MMVDIILYVEDQARSRIFYEKLFKCNATLDVPGMTEFQISNGLKLGLMPETGIAKIITPAAPHPSSGKGIPRCELYIHVENIEEWVLRSISAGARLISSPENRDWGDRVAYVMDPDAHVLAFAARSKSAS